MKNYLIATASVLIVSVPSLVWSQCSPPPQKLLASDVLFNDNFGISVAVSGDTAIVGANGHDELGTNSGAAYIFHWNGSNWDQIQKLMSSDEAAYDLFGTSVAIDGNRAVVVAPGKYINGVQFGATYVFHNNGSSWVQEQRLSVGASGNSAMLSASTSISGNVIVVGSSLDDVMGFQAGAAYVFYWNGTSWIQKPKLFASDAASAQYFGWSVAVFGDWIVVGAHGDSSLGITSGAAYIFKRIDNGTPTNPSDDIWQQTQKLIPTDGAAYDQFGYSLGINSETIVVGGSGAGLHVGAAYVYTLGGSNWNFSTKLSAGYPMSFGSVVTVSSDSNRIVVGAPDVGKSYIFSKNNLNWSEEARLTDPDVANAGSNRYGNSVTALGQSVMVGAYKYAGAAYAYVLCSAGAPTIASSSPPNGYIDALEDRDATTGALYGVKDVTITFSVPVKEQTSAGALTPSNFTLAFTRNGVTDSSIKDLQTGQVPIISSVTANSTSSYTLHLSSRIPLGAWTKITAQGVIDSGGTAISPTGNRVVLGNLPMDITQDGKVLGDDISRWLAIKNGPYTLPAPLTPVMLLDQKRSGVIDGPDINRAIQLLNGIGTFKAWTNFDMGPKP